MKLLISMGRKPGADPSAALTPALLLLNTSNGEVERELAPSAAIGVVPAGDEHREFTASVRLGDVLWQPTRTALTWISLPTLEIVDQFAHPYFHDVHDVCPLPDGGFAVSASGVESVLVFSAQRELVAHHDLGSVPFKDRYPAGDLRRVPADQFKPHSHHPNHVFALNGTLWATVFTQQEAVELGGGARIALPEGPPHDGRLREGVLWFTTVTGHVIGVDPNTLERVVHLNLNELIAAPGVLGWCRGIEVVGDRMFVGFTMLRKTASRELLRWLVKGAAGVKLPTRVVELDWPRRAVVQEFVVGNSAGGTIYSINALPEPGSDEPVG